MTDKRFVTLTFERFAEVIEMAREYPKKEPYINFVNENELWTLEETTSPPEPPKLSCEEEGCKKPAVMFYCEKHAP